MFPLVRFFSHMLASANENDFSEIWLVNTVQQRTLSSVSFHPIHMHTNHFQIIDFSYSTDTGSNEDVLFRRGEWRDTIPVVDGLSVTVRFLLDRFTGVVPTHCQVAGHQDQGMMRLARIVEESELTDDQLRVLTTTINDYTTAPQNKLGGTDTTEVKYCIICLSFLYSSFNCVMGLGDNDHVKKCSRIIPKAHCRGTQCLLLQHFLHRLLQTRVGSVYDNGSEWRTRLLFQLPPGR